MGYTMHEMNVILFSKEDGVFAMDDGQDNSTNGSGFIYDDEDSDSGWGTNTDS